MNRDIKVFWIIVNALALMMIVILAFAIKSNGIDSTQETSKTYGLSGWFEIYREWGFPNGKWGISNTGIRIHFQWLLLEYIISAVIGFLIILPFDKVIAKWANKAVQTEPVT